MAAALVCEIGKVMAEDDEPLLSMRARAKVMCRLRALCREVRDYVDSKAIPTAIRRHCSEGDRLRGSRKPPDLQALMCTQDAQLRVWAADLGVNMQAVYGSTERHLTVGAILALTPFMLASAPVVHRMRAQSTTYSSGQLTAALREVCVRRSDLSPPFFRRTRADVLDAALARHGGTQGMELRQGGQRGRGGQATDDRLPAFVPPTDRERAAAFSRPGRSR